jgi:lysozyme
MRLSAKGLDLIKRAEGFRATVYLDPAGVSTVGYGHRLLPAESVEHAITEEQAATILINDVRNAEQAVGRLVHVPLTQGQFDALVDFTFNLGAVRLAQSTLLRFLNAGHIEAAANEIVKWDYADGHELGSLKARRLAEQKLFLGDTQ